MLDYSFCYYLKPSSFFFLFWLMFTLAVQQYKIVYVDNIILCA